MNAIFCSSNESNQTDWRRTALVVQQLIERNRWKWWGRLMWEGNGEEKEQENARKRWKCASVLNRKRRRRGRRFVFSSSSLLLSYLITYLAIQVCVWSLVIWIIIIKDDMQVQFWNWSWSWCCRRTRRCIKRSRSFNVLDTPHHGISTCIRSWRTSSREMRFYFQFSFHCRRSEEDNQSQQTLQAVSQSVSGDYSAVPSTSSYNFIAFSAAYLVSAVTHFINLYCLQTRLIQ